jgi:hypothetical protein
MTDSLQLFTFILQVKDYRQRLVLGLGHSYPREYALNVGWTWHICNIYALNRVC